MVDSQLQDLERLALLITVRRVISGQEEPPVSELLQTNIIQMISYIFGLQDTSEEVRLLKLESIWILTNLAYGS